MVESAGKETVTDIRRRGHERTYSEKKKNVHLIILYQIRKGIPALSPPPSYNNESWLHPSVIIPLHELGQYVWTKSLIKYCDEGLHFCFCIQMAKISLHL
jgi:hypothetical protein